MKVTVGLCSRNRKTVLKEVLFSLCDQTLGTDNFEVVLVDDGSTDGTGAMVEDLRTSLPYSLVYLRQPHSGLATARNTGIRASQGEVILYIDDDVLAEPRLLEEHYKIHAQYDACVCNGWVNHVSEPVRPARPKFTMADISTSFFWTSNVSVKRKHLLAAGMFDEDFCEYGWEDQELGLRLMALGLVKRNNYKAIGFHVKGPPKPHNVKGALVQAEAKARTALLYIEKHPRLRSRLATGLHPPRLAWAAMSNWMGILESYCRSRLAPEGGHGESPRRGDAGASARAPEGGHGDSSDDVSLSSHQAWCLKQLSTIHYFRVLRSGKRG